MSEASNVAVLRAAERGLLVAYQWFPYSEECPEAARETRRRDERVLRDALDLVRAALKQAEERILNVAEHDGAKQLRASLSGASEGAS